jgi:hypothetical protein
MSDHLAAPRRWTFICCTQRHEPSSSCVRASQTKLSSWISLKIQRKPYGCLRIAAISCIRLPGTRDGKECHEEGPPR